MPWIWASWVDFSEVRLAAPPTWKVRMVSWVPGSPMDWAAMTPTASPRSTRRPRGKVQAVALGADAAAGFAGEHRADLDAGDAGGLDVEGQLLGEEGAGGDDDVLGVGIHDVVQAPRGP